MIYLQIPEWECYDEQTGEFETSPPITVGLEHSLLSVFRWEAKWKKPLLSLLSKEGGLTSEELLDYMGHMIVEPPVYPNYLTFISRFSPENIAEILSYLNDPQTATVINDRKPKKQFNRLITSELVYSWMASVGLSKDYETWNVNRLMTLINVIAIENSSGKDNKMSKKETSRMYQDINERNKAILGIKE